MPIAEAAGISQKPFLIVKILQHILHLLTTPLRTGWALIVFGMAGFWINWLFTDYPRPDFWPYLWLLGADLYIVAALFALLPRRWRLALKGLWHGGMYTLGVVECFLYKRFYIIYAPTALTLCLETNKGEAGEFLSSCFSSSLLWPSVWPWLLLLTVHLLTFAASLWFRRHPLHWKPGLRLRRLTTVAVSTAVVVYLAWQAPFWWKERTALAEFLVASNTSEAEKTSSSVFYSGPLRLVSAYKFYNLAQRELISLADNMQRIQVDSCRFDCPQIVLLIGESYNKYHSQVYGYDKETTPRQLQRVNDGEMVAFSDVVTPWNLTSSVFKEMLSTHSTDQPGSWTDGVLFPAVFRRAGYQVSFITNQFQQSNRQNKADFNGSFFLNDTRFDSLCFSHRSTKRYKYDMGMLRELSDSVYLNKTQPGGFRQPHLLICHLIGQHLVYAERFPKDRAFFHASDYRRPDITEADRQIIADYDNATRFNDEVVDRLCTRLRDEDALIIYLADHGDEVFDGTIGMYGRNHSADLTPAVLRGEFEIPFEVWGSSLFRRLRPELWRRIQQAKDKPFMIDDLPHLLFGLTGIVCPQYDARRDLFSPQYNAERPRSLKGGLGDYDKIMKKSEK